MKPDWKTEDVLAVANTAVIVFTVLIAGLQTPLN